MSEFVPRESAKVVIGVCGEQGSGKTVFLTCIFQSIGTAFPDDVIVDFERKEIGNANYFQSIEDALIAKGPTQGTTDRSLFPARIFVRPYEPLAGGNGSMLSVDLLDFAGRHFRSMADLKNLLEEGESDSEEIKALREVNEALEQADAFVILINSTEIDPIDETPRRNPFSPSVNFVLAHCRKERKPVALLFSQIDQTPRLTEELFRTLPRVQEFERKFTQDLQESNQGGRPFGIVRRISCYETVSGDLAPRRQTYDGSIWRREPAEVVLELLRAAMPRINERLAKKRADVEQEEARIQQEEQRERRRQRTVRIAALIGALVILGALAFAWYRREENAQVRLLDGMEDSLRKGNLASITPASAAMLDAILAAYRADPEGTASNVRAAIEDLEAALGEAAQRLAGEPSLEAAYREEIEQFQSLIPLFDPAATEPWRQNLLPLLTARGELLSDWFGTKREDRRARTSFLDESAKRFSGTGDQEFASLLAAQSTREKEAEIATWQARIDADADVASRLVTIQNLLASVVAEEDPELKRLARKALAGHLVVTILKRHENGFLREKLLTPLAPGLANLGDGEIRFEVLARDLLACENEEECGRCQEVVESAITQAGTTAANWSAGVDNLLRSLLLDLPLEERREVWIALADALGGAYLFSSREDAWPGGILPLSSIIRPAASAETDLTEPLIARIARHPLYEGELLYLGDHLTALASRRRVVPIYSNLLSALENGALLQTDGLAAAGERVFSALADRTEANGSLAQIGSEIEQVLALVRSVNDQRAQGGLGDASAAERLEDFLLGAKLNHCTALESHGSPSECANAA
ncbi:MAG TPA: hypothetical protein VN493_19410 [Thermoanaerobaculia bacterium]|nr:hypothetical protein [Thermoanaerobaculia bacterium]